ncbi:4Fe-4S dicluster domain-containing protein [Chloroflexota bacterium]
MAGVNRRDFIKYLVAVTGASALGKYTWDSIFSSRAQATSIEEKPLRKVVKPSGRAVDGLDTTVDPEKKNGMVIDVGACIGCRTCQYACKEENNTPDSISPPWIEVFQLNEEETITASPSIEELKAGSTTSYTESPKEGKWYLTIQCNHCDNPPCVKVCPTGATYKDKDGYVLMDYDRCIGCRFCVVSCPYGNRRFNWVAPELTEDKINPDVPVRPVGVPEKCTFCVHRTREGRLPRCVEVCPVQARHFGDFEDPDSEVSRLVDDDLGFKLLEELNTKPRIIYITRGKKYLR